MLTLSFLFDNYGLYPNNLIDNSFIIKDNLYKLEEVNGYTENDLNSLDEFSNNLFNIYKKTFKIIKNRKNECITPNLNKNYVLLSVPIFKINVNDVIKFNNNFINNSMNYTISKMLAIWLERYENIQKNCFNSIHNDDINYNNIYIALTYSFGLAENAITYLSDIKLDYGDSIDRISLSHIRLNTFESFSFFNPLNMIYDTLIRDYAELFKFELIDLHDLNKISDQIMINQKEASLLMARILYPTRIFDLLEDNYINEEYKFNKASEYLRSIDKELQRIKNIHRFLVKKYNIRPIKWLIK